MKRKLLESLLILLGLIMILSYIWMRFIRMRIPKDIPFNFSILGFFIMIYICFIYAFIVYNLIKSVIDEESSPNSIFKQIIKEIIDAIFLPACTFDQFIKNLPKIQKYHKNFMVYLASKLKYHIIETNNYYYFMVILPRLILVTALSIDTFWFHKLYYIYKVLLIAVLLVLNRYLIYSFKYIKESLITDLKYFTTGMTIIPFIEKLYAEQYAQMYEEDKRTNPKFNESDWDWELDEIPPTLYIKDIELFINFQIYNEAKIEYHLSPNRKTIETLIGPKKDPLNKEWNYELKSGYLQKAMNAVKEKMEEILQVSYIIHNYENTHQNKTATIKIKIFLYYFVCWTYILIISAHTLNMEDIIIMLNSTWENIPSPF